MIDIQNYPSSSSSEISVTLDRMGNEKNFPLPLDLVRRATTSLRLVVRNGHVTSTVPHEDSSRSMHECNRHQDLRKGIKLSQYCYTSDDRYSSSEMSVAFDRTGDEKQFPLPLDLVRRATTSSRLVVQNGRVTSIVPHEDSSHSIHECNRHQDLRKGIKLSQYRYTSDDYKNDRSSSSSSELSVTVDRKGNERKFPLPLEMVRRATTSSRLVVQNGRVTNILPHEDSSHSIHECNRHQHLRNAIKLSQYHCISNDLNHPFSEISATLDRMGDEKKVPLPLELVRRATTTACRRLVVQNGRVTNVVPDEGSSDAMHECNRHESLRKGIKLLW